MTDETAPKKWARLDAAGLLLAVEDARDEAWPHWAGPFDDLDCAPGRYVWDGERFTPIGFGTLRARGPAPAPEHALYYYLKAMQRAGGRIPPETLRWMEFYNGTLAAAHQLLGDR